MHNKSKYIGIAGCVIVVIISMIYLLSWNRRNLEGIITESVTETTYEDSTYQADKKKSIYVYVCGYVKHPGVYELLEGDRTFMAVELAGGILDEGCTEYMEMAKVLSDGERVYIPDAGEAWYEHEKAADSSTNSGLININTAGREVLMTLPGIGESRAQDIIAYRQEHIFESIDDIMKVSGIKDAAFSKIKAYICV